MTIDDASYKEYLREHLRERMMSGVQCLHAHDMHVPESLFSAVNKKTWPIIADDAGSYWRKTWVNYFNKSLNGEALHYLFVRANEQTDGRVIPRWMRLDSFSLCWFEANQLLKEWCLNREALSALRCAVSDDGKLLLLGQVTEYSPKELIKEIWKEIRGVCKQHAMRCAALAIQGKLMPSDAFPEIKEHPLSVYDDSLPFSAFDQLTKALDEDSGPRLQQMYEQNFPEAKAGKLVSPSEHRKNKKQ
ncbi:hypothetical protein FAI40_02630 [Acetobacteraceae bacterium]|nr:hypothetical protein FAI40_02630 [Acetobacteraceae bacterium]